MPLTAAAATVLGAGANLAGQAFNAGSQASLNKATRNWNTDMYRQQYADNIHLWNMQNEYNHPSQVMSRLRDAGLNPSLAFGNATPASSPSGATSGSWNPTPPRLDMSPAVGSMFEYYNLEQRKAQTANTLENNKVQAAEATLKEAQTMSTLVDADNKTFDLGLKRTLRGTSVDMAKEILRKTTLDNQYQLKENEYQDIKNTTSVAEAVQRIAASRAQTSLIPSQKAQIQANVQNLIKSGKLMQLDINLKKRGITWSDPVYLRVVGQIVKDITKEDVKQSASQIGGYINSRFPIGTMFKKAKDVGKSYLNLYK